MENWVTDENSSFQKKKAQKLVDERKNYEKKLIKEGKKKIYVTHPTVINCLIEKWV